MFWKLSGYGKPKVDLGQKKGISQAILLHNEHMRGDLPEITQCFPLVNTSDNKLALAEPKRHFST